MTEIQVYFNLDLIISVNVVTKLKVSVTPELKIHSNYKQGVDDDKNEKTLKFILDANNIHGKHHFD